MNKLLLPGLLYVLANSALAADETFLLASEIRDESGIVGTPVVMVRAGVETTLEVDGEYRLSLKATPTDNSAVLVDTRLIVNDKASTSSMLVNLDETFSTRAGATEISMVIREVSENLNQSRPESARQTGQDLFSRGALESNTSTIEHSEPMMNVSGTFQVNLEPLESYFENGDGNQIGRMSINKQFHGGLDAKSQGEMLSVMTAEKGSAGYVAIERVSGSLDGKQGSFVLQHYGVMSGGENQLTLEVVPGSGTGDLLGLSGTMNIRKEQGGHFYDLTYSLK